MRSALFFSLSRLRVLLLVFCPGLTSIPRRVRLLQLNANVHRQCISFLLKIDLEIPELYINISFHLEAIQTVRCWLFVHLPGCGDYMSALEVSNNKKLVASFFASKLATFALKNLSVSCLKELI
jgi:hypothetical protein